MKRVLPWILAVCAGCYWQRYPDLVKTHVEVLTLYARRVDDVVGTGGEIRPEDLTELRYPYVRARDFVRIVSRRFAGRVSLRRFEAFLDGYEEILRSAERARVGAEGAAGEIAPLVRRLERDGEAVLEALRSE